MFYQSKKWKSDKLFIYFHANGEDIGSSYEFLNIIRENLGVNIIAVEYPSYSYYRGEPSEDKLYQDADTVMSFITVV